MMSDKPTVTVPKGGSVSLTMADGTTIHAWDNSTVWYRPGGDQDAEKPPTDWLSVDPTLQGPYSKYPLWALSLDFAISDLIGDVISEDGDETPSGKVAIEAYDKIRDIVRDMVLATPPDTEETELNRLRAALAEIATKIDEANPEIRDIAQVAIDALNFTPPDPPHPDTNSQQTAAAGPSAGSAARDPSP